MKGYISAWLFIIGFYSCQSSVKIIIADTIIYNATIYTAAQQAVPKATAKASLDTLPPLAPQAIAIHNGLILDLGTKEEMALHQGPDTKMIDAEDHFLMPGFIEGHGHFIGLGQSLQNLNFLKDTSWQAIVQKVEQRVKQAKPGEWIYGRGWHQEKWVEQPLNHYAGYPTHDDLSAISPNNPVLLVHASGHSLFANKKAMDISKVSSETPNPTGGHIIKKGVDPTGVFEENAMLNIAESYNQYRAALPPEEVAGEWDQAVTLAQEECIKNGVTSFQDAGSKMHELDKYEALAKRGALDLRLWVMIRHSAEEMEGQLAQYRKVGLGDNHYTCRAVKTEVDGALGAHGAWLIEPYTDKPGFVGQNTTDISEVQRIAQLADDNDMQLCVHAIGDRANKEVLDIIESHKDTTHPKRWRVEHAQHLNPSDIMRFKSTGAIASMQSIHCTSDAPFVQKRLGLLRAKIGAYAWKALLNQGVTIVNGTDTPVEDVNPIENYYAAVTRTRKDNGMTFFVANKMTREEALKSYTIDAAYGAFEEDIKGSLEVGKLADMILLDKNLMTCGDLEILDAKVQMTMIGGKVLYEGE